MNTSQAHELTKWLINEASRISHGEVSLTFRLRDGHVVQTLKSVTESEIADRVGASVHPTSPTRNYRLAKKLQR